jgi:hypothetical protein
MATLFADVPRNTQQTERIMETRDLHEGDLGEGTDVEFEQVMAEGDDPILDIPAPEDKPEGDEGFTYPTAPGDSDSDAGSRTTDEPREPYTPDAPAPADEPKPENAAA